MKKSIYVCHTYYHVYISILKELAKPSGEQGSATIVLSKMSTDFEDLKTRLLDSGYFQDVLEFDEKPADYFPELAKYRRPSKNFLLGLWNRIRFTKRLAKLQESFVPADFRKYDEIYVFCDSDPIGYYLNDKHIYYHSVEDGLNTLVNSDLARADNTPYFRLKAFLSKRLNWIFIQNGYGRYCIDMEVNDISVLKYPCPYYIEVPRAGLCQRLTRQEKDFLLRIFVKNEKELRAVLEARGAKSLLILTEPLCDLAIRKKIFMDMIQKYEGNYQIVLKQHPRDILDYKKEFPGYFLIDRTVPMEMLNFYEDCKFDLVISVFTELDNVYFANNKLRLGRDFMDAYEDREIHRPRFESQ